MKVKSEDPTAAVVELRAAGAPLWGLRQPEQMTSSLYHAQVYVLRHPSGRRAWVKRLWARLWTSVGYQGPSTFMDECLALGLEARPIVARPTTKGPRDVSLLR